MVKIKEGILKVAIGALLFEGNTLSPVITELEDFLNKYYESGSSLIENLRHTKVEMGGAILELEKQNVKIVPLMATHGGAGGRVSDRTYKELRRRLIKLLSDSGRLDGVYLALHGAFIAEGVDDVEGDILTAVRSIVGDIPIVISCDLHAHITPLMVQHANMIVGYKQYPHDDTWEIGQRCAQLLVMTIRGEIRPMAKAIKVPMLIPPAKGRTAPGYPMGVLHDWSRQQECKSGVLTVSYFPVQPWLDMPDVGFTAVVITDGNSERADRLARELCMQAWERRHEFTVPLVSPMEAIRKGLEFGGRPVVLSDTADCTGGGASGDSAVMLESLLKSGVSESAVILIVDPETVDKCELAGEGSRFAAQIGNKLNPRYGKPVCTEVEVVRLFDGEFSYTGGILAGGRASMGKSALVKAGSVLVVLSSSSSYEYADEQFQAAGVNPRECKFVVVKNPMNYLTAYAYAPATMVLDTPGPTTCNLAAVPWKNLSRPCFPIDDNFTPRLQDLTYAVSGKA